MGTHAELEAAPEVEGGNSAALSTAGAPEAAALPRCADPPWPGDPSPRGCLRGYRRESHPRNA
ncbi:MAG: hypothetical protein ACFFD2_03670 [Promethearchaeota archaeon]